MAKLVNEYLAGQYPVGNNRLGLYDRLFAQKIFDSGIITTATGNPVSIVTNKAQNAISTILSYSPKQTGTNPSPQNICPIEGWTEANLTGAGKNIFGGLPFGMAVYNASYYKDIDTENKIVTYTRSASANEPLWNKFEQGKQYTFIITAKLTAEGRNNSLVIKYTNGTRTDIDITSTEKTTYAFVSDSGKTIDSINLSWYNANYCELYYEESGIFAGVHDTSYFVSYENPTETTISLGGTYYGFTVDAERGVLTVNSTFIDLGQLDWQYSNNIFFSRTPPLFNNGGTAKFNGTIIADSYVEGIVSLNTPINGRIQVANSQDLPILRLSDDRFDNADDLKIALNGRMAVIELAEPITYTLTPQTVALLAGNNTLWTDGDNIEITYKAKKQGG